jgi:uncharacterized protein YbjT (DUF2867 family)
VVEASLTDEGSLRAAFDGAYGAFLVTPFWEHRSPARDLIEVENLIAAAQKANFRHGPVISAKDTADGAPCLTLPAVAGWTAVHR